MTFAAAKRVPAVFVCNNNSWAISTPAAEQSGVERLVDKAVGYGMEGVRIDGADPLAVRDAVRDAAARARAGEGPQFIEAVTFRGAPHATADDPGRYMDPAQLRAARERECLGRFESRLRQLGVLDEQAIVNGPGRGAGRDGGGDRGRGVAARARPDGRSSTRPTRCRRARFDATATPPWRR